MCGQARGRCSKRKKSVIGSEASSEIPAAMSTKTSRKLDPHQRRFVMKAFFSVLLCSSLLLTSMVVAASGRQSSNQNQREDKIVIRANEVMVDVVVRDK